MQKLRVDTTALQSMAGRWAASAEALTATTTPAGVGLSCQASAAAVSAAHADIAAFTAALAARVGTHSTHVGDAEAGYLANEAESANEMAAVAPRMIGA